MKHQAGLIHSCLIFLRELWMVTALHFQEFSQSSSCLFFFSVFLYRRPLSPSAIESFCTPVIKLVHCGGLMLGLPVLLDTHSNSKKKDCLPPSAGKESVPVPLRCGPDSCAPLFHLPVWVLWLASPRAKEEGHLEVLIHATYSCLPPMEERPATTNVSVPFAPHLTSGPIQDCGPNL